MQDKTQIWNYIPVAEFEVPLPPASDATRSVVLRLWNWLLRVFHTPKEIPASEEPQWNRPSVDLLSSTLPVPNWKQAAIDFADALGDDWFENPQTDDPIVAFVGPPGFGIVDLLQTLAQQRQLTVPEAPSAESILQASNSNKAAFDSIDESDAAILVIPDLERWYLRHEDGLTVIRTLIELLIISRKRVLIGCDSWAWAFLQHAIGIQAMLGEPQTFAPFDAKRLDAWFRSALKFQAFEFRQCGNGEPVFPGLPPADKKNADQSQLKPSALMCSLAAKARGNPGVALALWRASLRRRTADADASAVPADTAPSVLWVVAPTELAPTQLPGDVDRVHLFVLHSVLLHGGLSLSSLVTLLPFSHHEIRRRVSALLRTDVLEEQDDKLRVTLTAYPLVRRDLQSEGFLTDAF